MAPVIPFSRVIVSKTTQNAIGQDNLLSCQIDEMTSNGFLTQNLSKAHHMTETFKDIHAALVSNGNKTISVK